MTKYKCLLLACVLAHFALAQPPGTAVLKLRLDSLSKMDQRYRSAEAQRTAKTPEEQADYSRKQGAIDVSNLGAIEKIISAYGYPGRSLVGEPYENVALMIIQHNDPAARERYLPLLMSAAEKGELKASSVALVVDRTRDDKGEKQLYGTQLRETKDGVKLVPIEDEANVNVRRAKVGLPPLEEYLKHWKIMYRVPSATYQNPKELYYTPEARAESPALIGGMEALYAKLVYPAKARENNISGFVTVELTVDSGGNAKNAQVVKSLGYGCDEEALRVIREARFTNGTGGDFEMRMRLPFPYAR